MVGTLPEVSLRKGTQGLLPCQVDQDVRLAVWSRGAEHQLPDPLVVLQYTDDGWNKSGDGYLEGAYDMDTNFSLIIKEVKVVDNNTFFCDILTPEEQLSNHTDVTVYGKIQNLTYF